MNKIFACFLTLLLITGCSKSKRDLYAQTDSFVTSLATTYEHYGLFDDSHATITTDGVYKINPLGRLINVRIEKEVSDKEYEELRADLERHYKDDKRVNKVYICGGGTVMIDCRN